LDDQYEEPITDVIDASIGEMGKLNRYIKVNEEGLL
jgi:hypothetical protein